MTARPHSVNESIMVKRADQQLKVNRLMIGHLPSRDVPLPGRLRAPEGEVKKVADANHIMPHKSTYFYPKIMTGLLFYQLVDNKVINRLD